MCLGDIYVSSDRSTGLLVGCRQILDAATGDLIAELSSCAGGSLFWNQGGGARLLDLDGDGELEVVTMEGVFTLEGEVRACLDGFGGPLTPLWLGGELWLGGRTSSGGVVVRAAMLLGEEPWWPLSTPQVGNQLSAVADVDGDGFSDVFLVRGGAVHRTTVFDAPVWSLPLQGDPPVFTAPTLADLGADGIPELLVSSGGGLVVLDAATGRGLARFEASPGGWGSGPAWADVDGDRAPEILLPTNGATALQIVRPDGEPAREQSLDWPSIYGHSRLRVARADEQPSQRAERAVWEPGVELVNLAVTDVVNCWKDYDPAESSILYVAFTVDGPEPWPEEVSITAHGAGWTLGGGQDLVNSAGFADTSERLMTFSVRLDEVEVAPRRFIAPLRVPRDVFIWTTRWSLAYGEDGYELDECSWLDNWWAD